MRGILYKSLRPASSMEEATQAFVFFWLAGLFVVTGAMLAFFSKHSGQRKVGLGMAIVGFGSLMATPWTLSC